MIDLTEPRYALLSVWNKDGLEDFAKELRERGIALIASGGTAQSLADAHIPHRTIEDVTAMKPLFDGRVKTLHPIIHGGILARLDDEDDARDLQSLDAVPIDVVVVNLYPFSRQRRTHDDDSLIEFIDIGGPALIRAAAKNHARVTVLCDPHQYDSFLAQLNEHDGQTTASYRKQCAAIAFAHTQSYDHDVAHWLSQGLAHADTTTQLPSTLSIVAPLFQKTRYGENPHQQGGFYGNAPSVAHASRHQGKELSWNNIHDTDAALAVVCHHDTAAAVIKHATLCGAARDDSIDKALTKAIAADPTSAFGGIIALNRPCTKSCAEIITQSFFEVILAPTIDPDALPVFAKRSNLRVLSDEALFVADETAWHIRSVRGGYLLQSSDQQPDDPQQWKQQTGKPLTTAQQEELVWAWHLVRHVRSNGIVITQHGQTIGIGGGATSRIDALKHALNQAEFHHGKEALHKAVLASDAFFPFADAIEFAAKAGIQTIIASGGSMRDDDVIAACQKHKINLFFAPNRHFKH